jgi:hypothetical protein
MKGESESAITAAHDQALQKKYHRTKIVQTETDSKCGPCQQSDETNEANMSACQNNAKYGIVYRMPLHTVDGV